MTKLTAQDLIDAAKESQDTQEVEIPGVGTILIRTLRRNEVMMASDRKSKDIEPFLLSRAIVEPRMSISQVRTWLENAPSGMVQPLVDLVQELSGLTDKAGKESVERFPGESE